MDQPPSLPETPPSPRPATSLAARLLNVFAVPGDVFEEVKTGPSAVANWLVPMILLTLVTSLTGVVMFSQPAIRQQLREMQAKQMDAMVKAGKMKQEDVDKAIPILEKAMVPMGIGFGVAAGVCRILWWAFVLWLMGRLFLKSGFGYSKALEVSGLAMMIAVLGGIVTLLLIVNLSRMFATPSLGLLIADFDMNRKSHLLMGAVNVFSFWLVGIMSVGLSKLAGVPFLRTAFLISLYWVLQELFFIVTGMGQMAL